MDRFSILKSSIQQDFSRGTYNFLDMLFKIQSTASLEAHIRL